MAKSYFQIFFDQKSVTVQIRKPSPGPPVASSTVRWDEIDAKADPDNIADLFEPAFEKAVARLDDSFIEDAVILAGSDLCFFRQRSLPFKSKTKIRQILPMELSATFPMENGSFLSRFEITAADDEKNLHTIFSASMSEDLVKAVSVVPENKGIRPRIMTPLALGLCAVYLKNHPGVEDMILAVPEAEKYTAVMVCGRHTVQVRTFHPGAENTAFDREIDRMILSCGQGEKNRFEKIMITQIPGASLPEQTLPPSFEPVPAFSLLGRITPVPDIRGLYNFCDGQYGSRTFMKTYGRRLVASAILAAFVFAGFMMFTYARINDLKEKIAAQQQIQARIFSKTFPGVKIGRLDPYLALQSQIKAREKKRGLNRDKDIHDGNKGIGAVQVLYELSRHIPASMDVTLTRMVLDPKRLSLSGVTRNFNNVDQVKGYIEKSAVFKSVEISSAASKKDGNVEFKFNIGM